MKSQRRHELQQNTLAHWMIRGPEWLKENASRILLAALVLVAIVVFYRRHQSSVQATATIAEGNLDSARSVISKMKGQLSSFNGGRGLSLEDAKDAKSMALKVIEDGPTPQLKARGYLALGDYHLALAQYPQGPGLESVDKEQNLKDADTAYNKVLGDFKEQALEAASARFGLATIEEDRGFAEIQAAKNPATLPADPNNHWANARQHLEAIANDDSVLTVLRDQAKKQIDELPTLQRRVIIAAATTRPATTIPFDFLPPTESFPIPTTAPATRPTVAPTTAPATTPVTLP